jgi:hypothetical protein
VEPDHPVSEEVVTFSGRALELSVALSRVARGGQVVLSERAWDAVKPVLHQHPGAAQVGAPPACGCVPARAWGLARCRYEGARAPASGAWQHLRV